MQKDKSILFVSYNAATEPLMRSQVLPYACALAASGMRYHILSFEKDRAAGGDVAAQLECAHIQWIRCTFHKSPRIIAKIFDVIVGMCVVLRTCISKHISLVHGRGVMGALIGILPAKLTGSRFVFDMKSSLAEAYRTSGRTKRGSFLYNVIATVERWCVIHADVVIVETRTHKEELETMLGARPHRPYISVLPCCVDVERFHDGAHASRGSSAQGMRIVYLGSLSGWYMIDEMLDFFSAMRREVPSSEFLFLSNDAEGALARLVKDKQCKGVTIARVSYDEVPKRLQGATAGVLFKRPNERLDSFPIKIAEYLAAGLPIIINAGMGDVEELVKLRRVGVVVRELTASAYTEAVRAMLALAKEGDALKKRCEALANAELSSKVGLAIYASAYEHSFQR